MSVVFRFATGKYTRFVVIAVWVVLFAALGSLQPKLQEKTKNDPLSYLPGDSDSAQVVKAQRDDFASGALTPALVLMSTKDGKPLSASDKTAITGFFDKVNAEIGQPGALKKALPLQSPFTAVGAASGQNSVDGKAAFAIVPLTGDDAVNDFIPAVRHLRKIAKAEMPDNVVANVTGAAGVSADAVEVFDSLDGPLLAGTALLVLVLLVLTYRSPVIWMIPLLTVAFAYSTAAGLVYLLVRDGGMIINGQTTSILIVLMFGAGTDYCLLMVSRLREELHHHTDPREAVLAATRATFGAILSSGSTVIAAMLVLIFASLDSTATMGPVLAIGIAASMLSAFTLLPALLSIGGRWAFWPRVPAFEAETSPPHLGVWYRVGLFVRKSPVRSILLAVTLLGVLMLGNTMSVYNLGFGDTRSFSEPTDSADGFAVLAKHFDPGLLAQTSVIVSGSVNNVGGTADEVVASLRADTKRVRSVLYDPARAERSRDGKSIAVNVVLNDDPFAGRAVTWINDIRDSAGAAATKAGGSVVVGGPTAQATDTSKANSHDQKVIIPGVLILIFLILMLLLRAVVAPIHLVLSVVASFFATLGLTTWLFVDVLNHPGVGDGYATFLFIFVVALGVDYNIFLVARIREETAKSNTVEGTVRALGFTGSVITSAGVILAGTFMILTTLPVYAISQIGIGVAVGVLLDTFVVRSFLVPAMMMLLNERNWWPRKQVTVSLPPDTGDDGEASVEPKPVLSGTL